MQIISQYFPLFALVSCDILYMLETEERSRLISTASVILHALAIIYFLIAEFSPEILLLFLLASFAAALTLAPKIKKTQEN